MEAQEVVLTAAPESKVTSTGLLVSVRNQAEATAAMAGGADWIDLKEPRAGALGAVDPAIATQVAQFVNNRCPLSAALGELETWKNTSAPKLLEVPGISYVKLGLSGYGPTRDWKAIWKNSDAEISATGKSLVAVAYVDWKAADAPSPEEVIFCAANSLARCLLIDTFDKGAGSTLECLHREGLQQIVQQAKSHKLKVVLAGKIYGEQLSSLPLESTDMLAVRGAVCPSGRESSVEQQLVARLKAAIEARH